MREKTDKTEIQQEGMLNKYALVLTSIKGIGVKTFSYLIPEELKPAIKIGQPVLVPFGRMGLINAFVVGFMVSFSAKENGKLSKHMLHCLMSLRRLI